MQTKEQVSSALLEGKYFNPITSGLFEPLYYRGHIVPAPIILVRNAIKA